MEEIEHEEVTKRRKESDAQRRKRIQTAIAAVLASESGRVVLKEILSFCQVESLNGQEGAAAGRIEGARAVGLLTVRMLRSADYAGFLKLYGEIYDDR